MNLNEGWDVIMKRGILPLEDYLENRPRLYANEHVNIDNKKVNSVNSTTENAAMNSLSASSSSSSSSSSVPQTTPVLTPNDAQTNIMTPAKSSSCRIFTSKELMHLYTLVYTLSTLREKNYSKQLYGKYSRTIENHIQTRVLPSLEGKTKYDLVAEMQYQWENHMILIDWLEKIFSYLDRYYVKANLELPLKQKGLQIFNVQVMSIYGTKAQEEMLELIEMERNGYEINGTILCSLISLYMALSDDSFDYYQSKFEESLLSDTRKHYSEKAAKWISELSFADYMKEVEKAFQDEAKRCSNYFPVNSSSRVRFVLEKTLLAESLTNLMLEKKGINDLLTNNRIEDLKRAYSLLSIVDDGIQALAKGFREFVAARGMELVDKYNEIFAKEAEMIEPNIALNQSKLIQRQAYDPRIVQDLLRLYDEVTHFIIVCFDNNLAFKEALKDAFDAFMNRNVGHHSVAVYISSACDQLMKCCSESPDLWNKDEKLGIVLETIVELFTYLNDKDLFADKYRTQMGKRLLTGDSICLEAEKLLVHKLKIKCGPQFTSKLDGMLNDFKLHEDANKEFREYLKENNNQKIDFEFRTLILTTGYWPNYPVHHVILPRPINQALDIFKKYYIEVKTSHRRLSWIHYLSNAVLSADFAENRKYQIQCNAIQASILLLYNEASAYQLSEMASLLQSGIKDIKKLIMPFIGIKLLLANRDPSSLDELDEEAKKSIEPTFGLNLDFFSPEKFLYIPIPLHEKLQNIDKVEEDRSFAIEAAIMRIMKLRKQMSQKNLIKDVIDQLKFFQPTTRAVKARLESLVDKECLECMKNTEREYKYLP